MNILVSSLSRTGSCLHKGLNYDTNNNVPGKDVGGREDKGVSGKQGKAHMQLEQADGKEIKHAFETRNKLNLYLNSRQEDSRLTSFADPEQQISRLLQQVYRQAVSHAV